MLNKRVQSPRLIAFEQQVPPFTSFDFLDRSRSWSQDDFGTECSLGWRVLLDKRIEMGGKLFGASTDSVSIVTFKTDVYCPSKWWVGEALAVAEFLTSQIDGSRAGLQREYYNGRVSRFER